MFKLRAPYHCSECNELVRYSDECCGHCGIEFVSPKRHEDIYIGEPTQKHIDQIQKVVDQTIAKFCQALPQRIERKLDQIVNDVINISQYHGYNSKQQKLKDWIEDRAIGVAEKLLEKPNETFKLDREVKKVIRNMFIECLVDNLSDKAWSWSQDVAENIELEMEIEELIDIPDEQNVINPDYGSTEAEEAMLEVAVLSGQFEDPEEKEPAT